MCRLLIMNNYEELNYETGESVTHYIVPLLHSLRRHALYALSQLKQSSRAPCSVCSVAKRTERAERLTSRDP